MKGRDKLLVGAIAGAGLLWGARALLRARRRISLEGRVVVITGGSTGLGLVMARQAAAEGALLVLAARHAEELDAAARELKEEGASEVLGVPTDVSVAEDVNALIQLVLERFGRVDILVNNAGTIIVGPVEAMTLEDYHHVMGTNFWGAVHTTLAVMPAMRRQGFGRIANIGSLGAKLPAPHMLPYTASKFALAGFSEGLRAELARDNILVSAIHPGLIHSGGHAHALFKGDKEAEYAWFSTSDVMPGLALSPEYVASRAWETIKVGDPELVVGWNAKLPMAFHHLFPDWFAESMALVDRMLPASVRLDEPASRGEELTGPLPSRLNRVVPDVARPGPASP